MYQVLKSMKLNKYLNTKEQKVLWKKMPLEQQPNIINAFAKKYPIETKFKWFSKNQHFSEHDLLEEQ
jgi:hypothetical protein